MMKQEQTQQNTQANSATHAERRSIKEDAEQTARPASGPRKVHRCANCDIEFFWQPTVVRGDVYCCSGCAAGGPCTCDYSLYRSVIIMGVVHYEQ
jgi:hypothetical protein